MAADAQPDKMDWQQARTRIYRLLGDSKRCALRGRNQLTKCFHIRRLRTTHYSTILWGDRCRQIYRGLLQ